MSQFLTHAGEIFETARTGSASAQQEALTILIEREGQIRIVVGESSSREALERFNRYDSEASGSAYRVSRGPQGIRVEGRSDDNRCVLEGTPTLKTGARSAAASLGLLPNFPLYSLVSTPRLLACG